MPTIKVEIDLVKRMELNYPPDVSLLIDFLPGTLGM